MALQFTVDTHGFFKALPLTEKDLGKLKNANAIKPSVLKEKRHLIVLIVFSSDISIATTLRDQLLQKDNQGWAEELHILLVQA